MEIKRPDPKNNLGRQKLAEPPHMSECFLAGLYYDGEQNKAWVKLYEPVSKQLFRWTDNTGHLSYCLVKELDQSVIKEKIGERYLDLERVERFEALNDQVIPMTKIVCQVPTDVGGRDDSIRNSIDAWEADIRYTDTYAIDTRLEPGMFYKIVNRKLIPTIGPRDVPQLLHEDEERLQKLMERWVRLTEAPVPDFRRVAVDIETNSPDDHHMYDPAESEVQVTACSLASSDGRQEVLMLRRKHIKELGQEVNGVIDVEAPGGFKSSVKVRMFDSEQELIAEIFKVLWDYPFVLTFNGDNYDFRFLYNRATRLDFQPFQIPIEYHKNLLGLKYGCHIDLMRLFANKSLQVYAFAAKYKLAGEDSVGLNEVSEGLLGEGKFGHEGVNIDEMTYEMLVKYSFQDARLTLNLTTYGNNLVMKLMTALSRLSYQSFEDLSREGASGWIRSLMFREHRLRNFVIPRRDRNKMVCRKCATRVQSLADEETGKVIAFCPKYNENVDAIPGGDILDVKGFTETVAQIKGKGFEGAFVEDPEFGLHFGVSVLDFASLYPSIYKTWNLGYDTIRCPHNDCRMVNPRIIPGTTHWVCKRRHAMQSDLIGTLRDLRVKYYKKKGKNPHYPNREHVEGHCDCGGALDEASTENRKSYYETVEQTLKVFLNAWYGVMAAPHFALYCPPVAESITAVARDAIHTMIAMAKKIGIKVIYGDTDSNFLETLDREKIKILRDYCEENLGMTMDIDKQYIWLALSQRKKNYIGLKDDGKFDIKGLTMKKRHTPAFIKAVFQKLQDILKQMATPDDFKRARVQIIKVIADADKKLKSGGFPMKELAFTMGLKADPSSYIKATPQHVKAARLIDGSRAGDLIQFVKVTPTIKEVKVETGVKNGKPFKRTKKIYTESAKPVHLTRPDEIDYEKYEETFENALEQLLEPLQIQWVEINGQTTLFGAMPFTQAKPKPKAKKKGLPKIGE